MRDILFPLAFIALIAAFIFVIRGLMRKPLAWRNAGISAAVWLILIALAPEASTPTPQPQASTPTPQIEQPPFTDQTEVAPATATQPETPEITDEAVGWVGTPEKMFENCQAQFEAQFGMPATLETEGSKSIDVRGGKYRISGYFQIVGTGKDPLGTDFDCVSESEGKYVILPISGGQSAEYFKSVIAQGKAMLTEQSREAPDSPSANTSPEADPNLKRLESNILPINFNNSRNVGGDVGDKLGAGLWLSAEAAGYKCHETEAYISPSVNSLKSDLKTDLENNNYSYTEIEHLGDKETGELITWKATGDITAIGFFATLADGAGSMAICRATPQ